MENLNDIINNKEYNKNFAEFYDKYLTGIAESMAYFYIDKLKLKEKKGEILDLMCGTGTFLNIFNNLNWKCTGVDLSSDMLDIAKSKKNSISYYKSDATTFISSGKYDLITCTADALNHLPHIEDLDLLFKNASEMLNIDGYFVFDMNTLLGSIQNDCYVSSEDENGLVIRNGFIDPSKKVGYTKFSGFFLGNNQNYLRFNSTIVNYIYRMENIISIVNKNKLEIIEIFDADNLISDNNIDRDAIENYSRVGFILKKSRK